MERFDHDLERGMRNRRGVLGDAWVDQSVSKANAFNADFQSFITRYAWHEIWGRPGLEAKVRRIIVLAITCALGRWEEFELHARAALSEGDPATRLTADEIKEVLMQSAIYAGVPAANTAVAHVTAILRALEQAPAPMAADKAYHPGTGRSHRSDGVPALHYTVREPRQGGQPLHTIFLSHSLGCDASQWDAVANALASDCRVVCPDHRGHGESDSPSGPCSMAELADDAARIIQEVQQAYPQESAQPVIWVGMSMGGMVGQELALRHPHLVKALVLANTSSGYDAAARSAWAQRMAQAGQHGIDSLADAVMQRWFSAAFHDTNPATVARWRRRLVSTPLAGYIGACEAIMGHDTANRLHHIGQPTLVMAGSEDMATPLAMSESLQQGITGAEMVVLPGAAHLSALEQPSAFIAHLRQFMRPLTP